MQLWKGIPFVALAVALSVPSGVAYAKQGKGPCQADIQKFCPNVQVGGGRYRDCLQQHTAELSPACQQHLTQTQAKVAKWRQACEADVQKLCSGVSGGRGKIAKCLRQHKDELSQSCKDQFAQRYQHRRHAAAASGQ